MPEPSTTQGLDAFTLARLVEEARAERDCLLDALVDMDDAICHGNPETAKRIAREAYRRVA